MPIGPHTSTTAANELHNRRNEMTRQEADDTRFALLEDFEPTNADVAMFAAMCVAGFIALCVGIYWWATL